MRNRFVSKFGKPPASPLSRLAESTKLGKDKLSDVEKLFEFARKRYAAPEATPQKDIPYSFQAGRRPDSLTTGTLKTELDAAKFAIKEIRTLASEARETFAKRRMVERTGEARDAVRHAIETEAFDAPSGVDMDNAPAPVDDEGGAASRRRRRRVGGLFRRR